MEEYLYSKKELIEIIKGLKEEKAELHKQIEELQKLEVELQSLGLLPS